MLFNKTKIEKEGRSVTDKSKLDGTVEEFSARLQILKSDVIVHII